MKNAILDIVNQEQLRGLSPHLIQVQTVSESNSLLSIKIL